MDYHVDRKVRFKAETEFKNLYSWALVEVDEKGQQVGRDQVPWGWSLSFTATEIVLSESLDIKTEGQIEGRLRREGEISHRRTIRAKLRSGNPRHDGEWYHQTTYRMFGSDREIKDFRLEIVPLSNPQEKEHCRAWGLVSYTHDSGFVEDTEDDIVVFYLLVRPETFDRYAARIAIGTADEIILRVGAVEGFYSEWSPDIETRKVKVLTPGTRHGHDVEMPAGVVYELPRLGPVGEAELHINAIRKQVSKAAVGLDGDQDIPSSPLVRPESLPALSQAAGPDSASIKMLSSIRKAAWVIAIASVIMMVATVT